MECTDVKVYGSGEDNLSVRAVHDAAISHFSRRTPISPYPNGPAYS